MKFKKMILPTLTGLSSVEKYNPNSDIIIYSSTVGIPFIIINGKVCDESGMPFGNSIFQDEFKALSTRAFDCKIILTGRVIPVNMKNNNSLYDLHELERITYESNSFSRYKENVALEVDDLFPIAIEDMPARGRHEFLKNIINSIVVLTKAENILLSTRELISSNHNKAVMEFSIKEGSLNKNLTILDSTKKYQQGENTLLEQRSFNLYPFEKITGSIKEVITSTIDALQKDKKEKVISRIIVNFNKEAETIDYSKEKQTRKKFLYSLIMEKKLLKSIEFEALISNGIIKHSRPL